MADFVDGSIRFQHEKDVQAWKRAPVPGWRGKGEAKVSHVLSWSCGVDETGEGAYFLDVTPSKATVTFRGHLHSDGKGRMNMLLEPAAKLGATGEVRLAHDDGDRGLRYGLGQGRLTRTKGGCGLSKELIDTIQEEAFDRGGVGAYTVDGAIRFRATKDAATWKKTVASVLKLATEQRRTAENGLSCAYFLDVTPQEDTVGFRGFVYLDGARHMTQLLAAAAKLDAEGDVKLSHLIENKHDLHFNVSEGQVAKHKGDCGLSPAILRATFAEAHTRAKVT